MPGGNRGFTLIEILVVITIIAALMGLAVVLVSQAGDTRDEVITKQRMGAIITALEKLKSPQLLGEYPPADLRMLRGLKRENVGKLVGYPNDVNVGSESLYVMIFLSGHEIGLADVKLDEVLVNADQDTMSKNPTRSDSSELFEIVDAWGTPFAYFSAQDMKNWEPVSKYRYLNLTDDPAAGTTDLVAKPWVSKKTGLPENRDKFQLFSAGPDRVFNTEDDVR